MVGSSQNPPPGQEEPKPLAKTITCTNCGGPITIRYPGASLSVSCSSCDSVLDVTTPAYRIISTHYDKTSKYRPILELGSRGELFGKKWEVIGFVIRTDIRSLYSWEEYLLFNPYYGFRWLTYNNGHWSFVRSVKDRPKSLHSSSIRAMTGSTLPYDGDDYRLYYRGDVRVSYVIGEFYWKVEYGQQVAMEDYVAPPRMLSAESDKKGKVWSVSEYIEPSVVREAFNPSEDIPPAYGMAPNKPSPASGIWKQVKPMWGIFLVVLTALQFWHMSGSSNLTVFRQDYTFVNNTKSASTITTPVFEIPKAIGNVRVDLRADVSNSWFYIYSELVNDETGETMSFERTIEEYHGYSGGEHWTEGSQTASVLFNAVPKGKYYLNIDTEGGDYPTPLGNISKLFTVAVLNDVTTFANWLWSLFLVSILPILIWIRSYADEYARWSDSDYSPYASVSDAFDGGDDW